MVGLGFDVYGILRLRSGTAGRTECLSHDSNCVLLWGLRFFGFYFIGIWSAIIVGFVVIVEKTGYSKNFASWDFPLRRVVFVPVGFAIVMGAFLLMMFLTGFLHR